MPFSLKSRFRVQNLHNLSMPIGIHCVLHCAVYMQNGYLP